jgi:alanine dehydrogenase
LIAFNLQRSSVSLIGVVKEQPGESRVAATPETVKVIVSLGYQVVVEKGAGAKAAFPDSAYAEAGAKIASTADAWKADIVLSVNAPTPANIKRLKSFVCLGPLRPKHVHACKRKGLAAVADTGLGHAINSDDPTVLVVDDDGAGVELHAVLRLVAVDALYSAIGCAPCNSRPTNGVGFIQQTGRGILRRPVA